MAGITNVSGPLTNFLGSDNKQCGYQSQQSFWKNGSSSSGAPNNLTATHILCLAIDLDNNRTWLESTAMPGQETSGTRRRNNRRR